jgi:ribulose-phosphate 3-epimerase
MNKIKIVPSILSADFANLGKDVARAEAAGADRLQIDVMDGHFVPNITVGPMIVEAVRRHTRLPLEVHLMITNPDAYLDDFAAVGADTLIVHQEVLPHLHRTLQRIKKLGKKVGVAINPSTPVSALQEVYEYLDLALVMTVNPGFGGQTFIESTLPKIRKVREVIRQKELLCELEVDGGINVKTAALAVQAGAEALVAGSAVYGAKGGLAKAIRDIRRAAEK